MKSRMIFILTLFLLLLAIFSYFFATKPSGMINLSIRELHITNSVGFCILIVSNTSERSILYDSSDPKSGRPQIMLSFMTNGFWQQRLEWGSPFASTVRLLPHESRPTTCTVEIPRETQKLKVGILGAALTWQGKLGEYIENHCSSRPLLSLGFSLKYRDVEKGLTVNWSQTWEVSNVITEQLKTGH